jgi:hypothetical protein
MFRGKLFRRKVGSAAAVLVPVVLIGAWAAAQGSGSSCRPHGTITFRGDPVSEGLKVEAFIEGQKFASGETTDGGYALEIPADDPATAEKDGWAEADTITIKVSGLTAFPSFEAFTGSEERKLQVPTLGVNTTTWGKIKALFK